MTDNTQPEALRDARWYMVDKDGMATLCTDREDAEQEAKDANMAWPHTAPHRAVQLVEVGTAAAELHRQHARIAELESQLESIGAGGVSGPLMGRPQAMPDLSALTERGAKAWAGVDAQGLRDNFTAADMATAEARGFRDGVASVAANAGSEPVATIKSWTNGSYWRNYKVEWHRNDLPEGAQLYTHPSPPEGMVGGWTKASQQLPPCRDDQLYVGINTAGFAGVFNAVADIAGYVHCMYETPEETIDVMSSLDIWQPFAPPTTPAGGCLS